MPAPGTERVTAWLRLPDLPPLPLRAFTFRERLSKHADGSAELAHGASLPDDVVPPLRAEVTLQRGMRVRRFDVVLEGIERHGLETAFSLASPTLGLALSKRPRRFRDRTVRSIVDEVLAQAGIEAVWRLTRELSPLPYVVQHEESDLAFVERQLAQAGAYFRIEDGRLVIEDSSTTSEVISTVEAIGAEGELAGREGIVELWRGKRVAPGRVTVADYDWKRPLLALVEDSVAERDGDLETYVWPGGFRDEAEGKRLARVHLEATRAQAEYAEGRSNVFELSAGRSFELGDAAGPTHAGGWFVSEIEHVFESTEHGDRSGYENRFVATPRGQSFFVMPIRHEPLAGLESTIARGPEGVDIHTDAFGRFKPEMPWDQDASATDEGARWARLLQECSSSMFLARTGWEMLVAFVDGDPARPVGIGRGMHGTMPPSYPQPDFQTATSVRTRSSPSGGGGGSEIAIDDAAGGQRIDLVAERDLATQVKNDQTVRVGGDASEVVGKTRQLLVRDDRVVTIGESSTTIVNGAMREAVAGNLTSKVAAKESIDVKNDRQESVKGNDNERVGSLRLTLDGGLASPADIAKSLIPSPQAAVAGALAAAKTKALAPVTAIKTAATAPLEAAKGTAGAATSVAQPQGVEGIIGAAGVAGSLPGSASGLTDAVKGLEKLPSAVAALPGALNSSVKGAVEAARSSLAGALKAAVPSLSSVANALPLGSINRKSSAAFSRRVGGAWISVTAGDITTSALLAYAEMVGGVRIKLTPKDVSTNVSGPLFSIVGGTVMRSSTKAMGLKAKNGNIKVAGPFSLSAATGLTINVDHVLVRSKSSITVGSSDATISLTPSKLTLGANMITDVGTIQVVGPSVDVTKG